MRIQHREHIAPGRKPHARKPGPQGGRRRANSVDSDDPDAAAGAGADAGAGAGEEDDAEPAWTEEELALFEKYPEESRYLVGYVVARAKLEHGVGEHEGLVGEMEAVGAREAELGAECEELLRRVMRKELG